MNTVAALPLVLLLAVPAPGQDAGHLGPVPTRDQFLLNLLALTYMPVPPDTLAPGAWEADLQCVEANTLEFSDVIKERLAADPNQRLDITREWAQGIARDHPGLPVIFLFQLETTVTTLRLRAGLPRGGEAWIQVPVFGYSGGFEDNLIEWVHRIGFYQTGRSAFPRNQVRVAVIQKGELVYYSDRPAPPRMQDPVLGFTQSLRSGPSFSLAASLQLKPSMTRNLDGVRSGWDSGLQLSARWSPRPSLDTYFGLGAVHRESGSLPFNALRYRDQLGAHATVEWRRTRALRPFFQLLYLTGATQPVAGQKLSLPSLQHDLGFHWMLAPGRVFTLRYINNVTSNENTSDMALAAEFTWRK